MLKLPLNTPICLKAHTGNNMHNEFFWRNARCKNQNTEGREQLILIKTKDGKFIIRSRWDNRNLQVRPSGECVFANYNQDWWEKFDVERIEDGKIFFVSCHTGKFLQCNKNGVVSCANKKRGGWEAWTVTYTKTTEIVATKDMAKFDLALNTPICLKAHTGNNMHNEFLWRNARCKNQNTKGREQLILIKTKDDKFIIQSRWDNRNLQVRPSGECVFANYNQDSWEKFDIERTEDGKIFFVSCHTGKFLQCDKNGIVSCANRKRGGWEAWTITYPKMTEIVTFDKIAMPVVAIAVGAALPAAIGLLARALVPTAMSTFGTVVPGVGTIHASKAAGGIAATLQASSALLTSTTAAVIGGVVVAAALPSCCSDDNSEGCIVPRTSSARESTRGSLCA